MGRAFLTLLLVVLTRGVCADSVEVEGILVVSGCQGASYRQISLTEPAKLEIAAACAKRGVPLALLVGEGASPHFSPGACRQPVEQLVGGDSWS